MKMKIRFSNVLNKDAPIIKALIKYKSKYLTEKKNWKI